MSGCAAVEYPFPMGSGPAALPGGDRFEIGARLGSGAMGVVYRARDRERDCEVALKLLRALDPAAIFRFKHEFRALADVVHPNLVTLYELVSTGDQWFFTMELIEGTSFLRAVRGRLEPRTTARATPDPAPNGAGTAATRELRDTGSSGSGSGSGSADSSGSTIPRVGDGAAPLRRRAAPLNAPEQFARLREYAGGLAEGIAALHRAGHLHRDIKPSNVMVTATGRVVLLDFGVVAALAEQRDSDGTLRVIGTPVYMAPEQAAGRPLSEASDWYSFGVMLYEALSGAVPFDGAPHDVVAAKQLGDPPPLDALAPDTPEDLAALCMALLQRDPSARPGGAEVRRRFGGSATARPAAAGPIEIPLIGRDHQLARLQQALAATQSGQQRTACVSGSSGMGKSALLREFVRRTREAGAVVVLEGRCHERESVPYKALDSLVDALAQHLIALPEAEVAALLPPEMPALARIFPVLKRVEAVIDHAPLAPVGSDLHELRGRAFSALRALLSGLAAQRPLVLVIDDLQWGDPDSATMLTAVLEPPRPPPLLLVACYRSEDAGPASPVAGPGQPAAHGHRSPFLRAFLSDRSDIVDIPVDRLPEDHARELVDWLLADADDAARAQAETIARESAGNPLLAVEMTRFVRDGGGSNLAEQTISFEALLGVRLATLPAAAVRLLEVVAVAGQPVTQKVARRAAGIDAAYHDAVASLRAARLVWTRGSRGRDLIESNHDRIRDTVIAGLSDRALRDHHLRLARALLEVPPADPEALATHFAGAGDRVRAAQYCIHAATNASEALAFDRAAALLGRAIELDPPSGPARSDLWARRGEALANAGSCPEAADAYREAAATASAGAALDYQRRAAEQLLHCGKVDEGVEALHAVARAVGIKAPETPRGALASLLLRRAWLRLRGLRFHARDAADVSPAELTRIEVCATAMVSYGMFDPVRGAEFQTRNLLLALRAGERAHLAQALAGEAGYWAASHGGRSRRCRRLLAMAETLAEQSQDDVAIGDLNLAKAMIAYMDGSWAECHESTLRLEALLRQRAPGLAWERVNTQLYQLWSLYYLGEVGELARRLPSMLSEARARGDLFSVANLCTGLPNLAWLMDDRSEEAHSVAREVMTRWSLRGFHLLHYREVVGHVHAYLYEGDGPAALELLLDAWKAIERSLLFRVSLIRLEAASVRARCHLATAIATGDDALLATAERESARLCRSDAGWAAALGQLTAAGAATARGRRERAIAGFAEAATRLQALDMSLFAAAARWRHGELVGGDEGAARVAEATEWMANQGIARPAAFAAVFAPVGGT